MTEMFLFTILNSIDTFFKKKSPFIIVFIIALLLGIGVSHPQTVLNDEWITLNQLAQIDHGHQFVVNEGKYGFLKNGTPYAYFQARNNMLGYPIFLPLLSVPALALIKLTGDPFDYWMITFWTLLLIFLGCLVQRYYPRLTISGKVPVSTLIIISGFILFFLNMAFYAPFTVSPDDAPREAAAIILTGDLLFAGAVTVIYGMLRTVFDNDGYVWFGTITCVTCSSYLIWASSAKDHMLEIFLFTLIIYGLVQFLYSKKARYCFFSFLFLGLLAWDRPETGIFLLFFLFAGLTPYVFLQWKKTGQVKHIVYFLFLPLFTVIGAIPFFINNYIVTKSPLVTTYAVWGTRLNNTTPGTITIASGSYFNLISNTGYVAQLVLQSINPHSDTFIHDLVRILFLPESGSIGVLILVPVFLIGLLFIPLLMNSKPGRFSETELFLVILLICSVLAIFTAYISAFPVLNKEGGVMPDVRYLSPLYIPLNIIGLLVLSKFPVIVQNAKNIITYSAIFSVLTIPLFLAIIFLNAHNNSQFFFVLSSLSLWTLVFILFIVAVYIISGYFTRGAPCSGKLMTGLLGLIIIIPFVFQIMIIFLLSIAGSGLEIGYTYWLPIVRHVSESLYNGLAPAFLP